MIPIYGFQYPHISPQLKLDILMLISFLLNNGAFKEPFPTLCSYGYLLHTGSLLPTWNECFHAISSLFKQPTYFFSGTYF